MAENFKVTFSKRATADLDAILSYLLTTYGNPVARKAYLAINQKLKMLERMPTAFPSYSPENRVFKSSYRYVIAHKSYRVIYKVLVENMMVRVLTIRHVRTDPGMIIQTIEEE